MPILNEIETLEQSVQRILENAGANYRAIDEFSQFIIREVERLIPGLSTSTDPADIREALRIALIEADGLLTSGLTLEMSNDITSIIDETLAFYQKQGIRLTTPQLIQAIERRRDFRAMQRLLNDNISQIETELFEGTMKVMEEAITSGEIVRDDMMAKIKTITDTQTAYARTNARTIVSGYNRISRLEIADSAQLNHALYYGQIASNTRPFCGLMVGKVMSREQIEALDNGQGLDVKTFCGGWNCIHSWLWVSLEWDAELGEALYNGPLRQEGEGKRSMTVPVA